jgi:hypothetical protein
MLFNTRLQRRYFNERNNVSEPSVSIQQEFPDQLSIVTEQPDLQAGSEVYHGSFHGSRAAGALG